MILARAQFSGPAYFESAQFSGRADFHGAQFSGQSVESYDDGMYAKAFCVAF